MRHPRSSKLRGIGICAAIAVGTSLGVFAPPAMAAPANDDFANRAEMPSTLPAEVEGSNVGATAESGEMISGQAFDAHHSVWWEWQAPETRLVAVGTCGTEFGSRVGIFTGEALSELLAHRVVPAGAPEPGGCERRYIFEATAGTKYELGVDGDGTTFPGPEGETLGPPVNEGQIKLRIAPEPAPANDDIANAAKFEEIQWELPDGKRQVLGNVGGTNWGATLEPGEPEGAGAGASVWYRWTPVETSPALITAALHSGGPPVLDIYARGAAGTLTRVATSIGEYPTVFFDADEGQEYLVRVAGAAEESGLPWMGTFTLALIQNLPPGSGPPPTEQVHSAPHKYEAPPASPPSTNTAPPPAPVIHAPTVGIAGTATVRFGDGTPGVSFRCKVDANAFHGCASPLKLRGLAPGRHRLEVRAKARNGVGSRSAVLHFRVPPAHRNHHAAG
jgi:hypothetical protein